MTGQAKQKPAVLIMTATIQPSARMGNTTRRDPALRLRDYVEALEFYLETLDHRLVDRIVVAENSGSDISALRAVAERREVGKQVEFVSFSSDVDPSRGKGCGELHMLDQAITKSNLIEPDDVLWKVTGRLRIQNITNLIASAPRRYSLYCDLRSLRSFNGLLDLACRSRSETEPL
jgi:hypothetical protein